MDARRSPKSSKPSAKAAGPGPKPGDGLLGWLGRQIGHVTKAVKADVTQPAGKASGGKVGRQPGQGSSASAKPGKAPPKQSKSDVAAGGEMVLYRENKVEEAELPDRPGVILRRTIIDEVVVDPTAVDEAAGQQPKKKP
jgi:hypothetical protein